MNVRIAPNELTPVLSQGKSVDLGTGTAKYENTVPTDVRIK